MPDEYAAQGFEIELAILGDDYLALEHAASGQLRLVEAPTTQESSDSAIASRLWIRISFLSQKTNARTPPHLGSKIQIPPIGNSPIRLDSIGNIGGFIWRFTFPMLYRLG